MAVQTLRAYACQSAVVDKSRPGENFPCTSEALIRQCQYNPYGDLLTTPLLLQFDLTPADKKRIVGYSLNLYTLDTDIPAEDPENRRATLTAIYFDADWQEGTVTFSEVGAELTARMAEGSPAVCVSSLSKERLNQWSGYPSFSNILIPRNMFLHYSTGRGTYSKIAAAHAASNKPYLELQCEDVQLYVSSPAPAGGVVDETRDTTFSWAPSFDASRVVGTVSQSSARLEWRDVTAPATVYSLVVQGTDTQATIPANTLPSNGAFEWRVRADGDNGAEGIWSAWYRVSTVDSAKTSAVDLKPDLSYVAGDRVQRFSWTSVSPLGTPPHGYELQKSEDGIIWTTVASAVTSNSYCDVPAHTFSSGNQYWRVRTYNSDNVVGEWSAPAQITIISAPQAPQIIGVTNHSYPTITWQATGQYGYRVQIIQGEDIIYDTRIVAGSGNQHTVANALVNGNYIVRMRIAGINEAMSDWSEYPVVIAVPSFADIILTCGQQGYGAVLKWTISTDKTAFEAIVLRDGVPVASCGTDTQYKDYLVPSGEHVYSVRVQADGDITDSQSVTVAITLPCILIAPVDRPDDILICRYDTERSSFAATYTSPKEYIQLSGRRRPMVITSDFETETLSFGYVEPNDEVKTKLLQLVQEHAVWVYRDAYGAQKYIAIDSISYKRTPAMYQYSIAATVVDYQDYAAGHEGYSVLMPAYQAMMVRDG